MARAKISQLDPKGADLSSTDLFEVSVNTGSGYDTYSITGQEIINGGSGVYVPYTGATQDVDLDANKLSAESIYIEGTNGAGHLHLKHQNADATATGQSTALFADVNGDIKYKNDNDYYTTLKTSLNTADRVYTFPNADCTLVPNGAITTSGLTMETSRLLGRTTALNGAVEEISIGSGLTLSGGTLSSTGGGITVGTTAVTSGTDTRVFFQQGGVIQQDANFTFNNTQKRLTLKAVGTAGTDIPLSIGNSAGTVDLFQQNGVGSILARSNDTFSYAGLFYRSDGANGWSLTNSHSGYAQGTGIETVGNNLYFLNTAVRALSVSTQGTGTFKTYGIWNYGSGSGQRLLIGENVFDPQVTLSGTGNLGIGTYTAGARLDVRAQGALSTDIAFRVRNSADSLNFAQFNGDGTFSFKDSSGTNKINSTTTSNYFLWNGNNFIEFGAENRIYSASNSFNITVGATKRILFSYNSVNNYSIYKGAFQINTTYQDPGTASNSLIFENGTVPSTNLTNHYWQYSADIVAGNAAPHFRTENGAIVKIYQETTGVAAATFVANTSLIVNDTATFDGYTIGQVVKALRNLGILA